MEVYYKPAEVAKILNIKTNTVYRMIANGRLQAVKLGRKICRIPEKSLHDLTRANTAE